MSFDGALGGGDSLHEGTASEFVVDWDGENDPANPMNWPKNKRILQVVFASAITMVTSLAATMVAPGIAQIMEDFHTTNVQIGTLAVSIYLLGFAVGPLIIAPLSELYGRLPAYHVCNLFWMVFTVACAVSTNMPMFVVFRFLAGSAGSCPLTIGGGTVVDVMPQQSRGAAMSIFAIGPLLGPVLGPIAGGFLAQAEGWRWVFWVLTITIGILGTSGMIFMRETFANVLLERKAALLRKKHNNPNYVSKFDTGLSSITLLRHAIVRPFIMLFMSPVVVILSTYTAIVFAYLFLLFTTFPKVFEEQYHWSGGVEGLAYIGIGVGLVSALVAFSFLSDWLLKKQAGDGPMKPEHRLPVMKWTVFLVPIGLFWYGWSAQAETFWLVPIMGTALIGAGAFCTFMPTQTYLVDCYGKYAASALAANTVLRSILGCILPLAGPTMYSKLGLGWGNSLLGFVALAFSPVPFIFFIYGERIRQRFAVKL
ncbi:MFS general substrate transporter [Hyaloscypha variabilis F]|uniref:MFS general substrate transporter n=1 Tax=Hyaloscypha variabilis (strain UAMH 11265 / GT02V1 / F) TaxID=1149755 RepID=A0A2J6RX98_HYAVF|nr:MFS general substrate transporter [Hyaloscypha variabilis F]